MKTATNTKELVTIGEASDWATSFLRRQISESNISYLVQYGKVEKHNGSGSAVFVNLLTIHTSISSNFVV